MLIFEKPSAAEEPPKPSPPPAAKEDAEMKEAAVSTAATKDVEMTDAVKDSTTEEKKEDDEDKKESVTKETAVPPAEKLPPVATNNAKPAATDNNEAKKPPPQEEDKKPAAVEEKKSPPIKMPNLAPKTTGSASTASASLKMPPTPALSPSDQKMPAKPPEDSKMPAADSKMPAMPKMGGDDLPDDGIIIRTPTSRSGEVLSGAAAAQGPGMGRELKVEDALLYLDQVKLEFGDRPRIYNEFLEIMKNFKAQEVDTIGVINRVRRLFHGYNNLILGFNTFLPDGYKIEMKMGDAEPVFIGPGLAGARDAGRGGRGGRGAAFGRGRGMPQGRGMAGRGGRGSAVGRGGRGGRGAAAMGMGMKPTPQQQQQMMAAQNAKQKQGGMTQQQQQGAAATRTIEFDHAIMYVTNIKKRFANQPRIYHTFLEILHTYQKEQRGIKEVLEQVSSLFSDHPDLLREFTFFLPDAVQEQAKERLSRAAAEAEARQRAASLEASTKQQRGGPGFRGGATPKGKSQGLAPQSAQKFIDMTQPDEVGMESPQRSAASGKQPNFVYNAGVERQFFDLVKAALTSFSRDGQAYAEFIKTLDMYAQEILSRNDMLGYVERLLGKHKDLFEEFKGIINAVGSPDAPTHDDSWHSVPLSEIDFSRCRRCSPSYRALPRDYPAPPCSERSTEEAKVLNDVWVSLPLGSEEGNSFRHMRKNQYEETLFRTEDMRFEIDMCIDSNATTLQRLTKIYDELKFLSDNELQTTKGSMVKRTSIPDGAGLGGKIYQYTLDGRVLGVIHKHAIRRIYGDDGSEMLQLCFKNPAVALPIVMNRLRQKDEEFRAAREVLNKKWKDLGEHNYYKSVDHRSITWRTIDKKVTSTRVLVAEIKDRAANDGLESEATCNSRMDKAKEEHGTFYEITMGRDIPRKSMDLKGLPLPTKTIFTPHMSFVYDCNSWAQQDAYRIIAFALERGSINPGDKERIFRLWRDFIGPWFGLGLSWMSTPAASFSASPQLIEEDDEENSTSMENGEKGSNDGDDDQSKSSSGGEDEANAADNVPTAAGKFVKEEIMKPDVKGAVDTGYFSLTNHVPFPPETLVSTTLGEGKVVQYNEDDRVYEVSYPSKPDTTLLKPDAVFGSLDPVEPSLLTEQLRSNDPEVPLRSDDHMIIGTQCLYLFFRLHQLLIKRLIIAKKLATDVSKDKALSRHTEKLTYKGDPNEGKKRYDAFIGLVYSLIESGVGASEPSEGGKFEDRVRHLLGNNAYELTTMDKLISHVLKHLRNMANNETMQNMVDIYRRHELAGNFKPTAFREEAALVSDGENMYAFQICNMPKTDQKISHCEFLGVISEEDEDDEEEEGEDNKRGIDDVAMDDAEVSAQNSKRSRR